MALITWKYCTFLLTVLSLLLAPSTAQTTNNSTSVNPEITQAAETNTSTTSTTTVKVPTTPQPVLPLLPETEGQPDFYVYKTEHGKLVPCSRTTFVGKLTTGYKNKEGDVVPLDLEVSQGVTVEGECGGEKTSSLVLHWGGTNFSAHYLNFTFVTKPPADSSSQFSTWVLQSVVLACNMDSDEFQDPQQGGFQSINTDPATSFFETPLGLSYSCISEQSIGLEAMDNSSDVLQSATLTLSSLQLQPFQLDGNGVFSEAGICDADLAATDEVVGSHHTAAIAIATVLSIVIVGTLVTYCWVKRSHKPRYTSME